MATGPIFNPPLPFVGSLGYIEPNLLIKVRGKVDPSAKCFAINLQCGPLINPRDDIALHLSPVFTSPPRVVRNSLVSSKWGPEESHGSWFPFACNQNFEVMILVESDEYKIAVNGSHFTEFKHRIPYHKVTHLSIDGDVVIHEIHFESNTSRPSSTSSLPSAPPAEYDSPFPADPLTMPPYGPGVQDSSHTSPPYPINPTMPTPGFVGAYGSAAGYGSSSSLNMPHTGPYPTQPPYSGNYPSGPYPSGPYPSGPQAPHNYPTAGYANAPYPQQPGVYPTQSGYPSSAGMGGYPPAQTKYPSRSKSALGGLGGVLAAIPGASAILGTSGYPGMKKSAPIPIAGVAAGVGAAALGAAMLNKPFKKVKKLYKHKYKAPKFFKHKFGKFHGWKHKGWSSDSS